MISEVRCRLGHVSSCWPGSDRMTPKRDFPCYLPIRPPNDKNPQHHESNSTPASSSIGEGYNLRRLQKNTKIPSQHPSNDVQNVTPDDTALESVKKRTGRHTNTIAAPLQRRTPPQNLLRSLIPPLAVLTIPDSMP